MDRLRKAVDAAEGAAQDVAGYRKTAAALGATDERTAARGEAICATARSLCPVYAFECAGCPSPRNNIPAATRRRLTHSARTRS